MAGNEANNASCLEGEIPNLNNTYPNKSNNPFFARDAAYSDSKDLADRTI